MKFLSHGYRGWHIDHSTQAHRRAGAGTVSFAKLLAPLEHHKKLGSWPHLLWSREELPR